MIGDDEPGVERMKELARNQAVDVAVETVGGTGETLLTAQRVVRPKGKVIVLGVFTHPNVQINALHLAVKEPLRGSQGAHEDGTISYTTSGECPLLHGLQDCPATNNHSGIRS